MRTAIDSYLPVTRPIFPWMAAEEAEEIREARIQRGIEAMCGESVEFVASINQDAAVEVEDLVFGFVAEGYEESQARKMLMPLAWGGFVDMAESPADKARLEAITRRIVIGGKY